MNLLCHFSRVSVAPFITASGIFYPISLLSTVFPIMLFLFSKKGSKDAEQNHSDDVAIATWHLHLWELRTAAGHAGWQMALEACRWSKCPHWTPLNSVLLLKYCDGFYSVSCTLVSFDPEQKVPETFFLLRDYDRHYVF